jgi:hypothetical protein
MLVPAHQLATGAALLSTRLQRRLVVSSLRRERQCGVFIE